MPRPTTDIPPAVRRTRTPPLKGWIMTGLCMAASAAASDVPPTLEAVRARLDAMPRSHPRLFGDADAFQRVRDLAARDPVAARMAAVVLRDAEALLDAPPVQRRMNGRRLLFVSRQALRRATTLGMAWQLSGRAVFAERLARELRAAADFTDWNPAHFLDTAEMTLALAVGYDWAADVLADDDRVLVRRAIRDKGLLAVPDGAGWITGTNNWTAVCHAGLVAGALVTVDDDPELAARVVQRAVANLPRAMRHGYAPDGMYPEGPMYWAYGTSFNVALLAMLDACLGTDFGLADLPGFDRTVDAYAALLTPSGGFYSFYDSRPDESAQPEIEPAVWWLARRFDRPEALRREVFRLERDASSPVRPAASAQARLSPLALLWFTSPPPPDDAPPARFTVFDGPTPVAVFDNRRPGRDAFYVAAKGGRAGDSHAHMDAGSFVLEADGVRWAVDLGMHDYHRLESQGMQLWEARPGGVRWTVSRYHHLSHNTLVIDGKPHTVDGRARIVAHGGGAEAPWWEIDLTPTLSDGLTRATRRFDVSPVDRSLTITDRLVGLRPGATVRWAMATRTTPVADEANKDGERNVEADRARLTAEGGARLTLDAAASDEAGGRCPGQWTVHDLSRPPDPREDPLPGVRLMGYAFPAPPSGTATLRVVLTAERDE